MKLGLARRKTIEVNEGRVVAHIRGLDVATHSHHRLRALLETNDGQTTSGGRAISVGAEIDIHDLEDPKLAADLTRYPRLAKNDDGRLRLSQGSTGAAKNAEGDEGESQTGDLSVLLGIEAPEVLGVQILQVFLELISIHT